MKEFKKKIENKKKLLKFLENGENKMLTVWFFTLVSYLLLYFITKNMFVLLFGYFIFYIIYSRFYMFLYRKIKNELSFSKKIVNSNSINDNLT